MDAAYGADCANKSGGHGHWFRNTVAELNVCSQFTSHLNGLYSPINGNQRSGIQWTSFTGDFEALPFSEMKLRRRTQQ